jgi:hypothetical protein
MGARRIMRELYFPLWSDRSFANLSEVIPPIIR